ncbi:hypothetical protein N7467_003423 [Penicillium canescens]|nr:hypothetical protein N7467_003423 [Penicillium canescens]
MADAASKACDSHARIIQWIEEVQGHDQRSNTSDNFHGIATEYRHTYEALLQHYGNRLAYPGSSPKHKEKRNEAATR